MKDETRQLIDSIFHKEEEELEKMIQEKGLNAPRVKPSDLNENIKDCLFHRFEGTNHITCCIVFPNGWTVTGNSACVFDSNFDEEVGKTLAFKNARKQIWKFKGYELALKNTK